MKSQLAMVIDSSRCIDCRACMVACKVANDVPEGLWRNWIKQDLPDLTAPRPARAHFQPGGCMHCDNPTCVAACPTGATFKSGTDGTVVIDQDLCIGCGNCIPACPYAARYRHPEKRKAEKCDFCTERRARGRVPACVDTCPTKARVFGDINDPSSEAAMLLRENPDAVVRVIHPESDTKPNMFYLGSTAPLNWPARAVMPTSMQMLTAVVGPAVKVAVGMSGIGVLAMFGRQLLTSGGSEQDETEK
jgi:tetrathionate reductase subunit B